jgi:hypothetical protein
MTIRDLEPGAVIARIGEEIYIDDKQQHTVGARTVTEFRVRRGLQKTALWVTGAQVQQWLGTCQAVTQ